MDLKITHTGLNEMSYSKSIKIYPNPFSESTSIEIHSSEVYNHLELKCFNSLGKEVETYYSVLNNKIEIRRGKMAQGCYFIEITNNGKAIGRGVVVVEF